MAKRPNVTDIRCDACGATPAANAHTGLAAMLCNECSLVLLAAQGDLDEAYRIANGLAWEAHSRHGCNVRTDQLLSLAEMLMLHQHEQLHQQIDEHAAETTAARKPAGKT